MKKLTWNNDNFGDVIDAINEIMDTVEENHKPIIVYKLKIGKLPMHEIRTQLRNFVEYHKNERYEQIFLPIRDGESDVECIYPKEYDDEVVAKLEEIKASQNAMLNDAPS